MLNGTKSPFLSRTVVGGGVALLMGLVQIGGYVVSPADAADASAAVTGLITSGAGILAVVGRILASKRVSLRR